VDALGDAETIVNVGAGAGSYEPAGRFVVAVEPSGVMIAQRKSGAPVVCAVAEALPFADRSFDAATAFLTVHHWPDQVAGLKEMMRVAKKRCVIFTWTPPLNDFWLTRDYLPELVANAGTNFSFDRFEKAWGSFEVRTVPVPEDCTDGFLCAYWKRPEAYFDPGARLAMSTFSTVADPAPALARLRSDLADGSWARRNADLLEAHEMDYGYRIIIAERRDA
jgi:ubiquinone/menaquinone biosynthesis C-methylase UbiE